MRTPRDNCVPLSRHCVQPNRPFHCVRLSAVARAGRSNTQLNSFALRHLGPAGVSIGTPSVYKAWIFSNIGFRTIDKTGLTGPNHIPASNWYLKSIRMFGGKLVMHSCTGHSDCAT